MAEPRKQDAAPPKLLSETLSVENQRRLLALAGVDPKKRRMSLSEARRSFGPRVKGDPFSRGLSRGFDITQMGYGSALEGVGKLTGIASLQDYGASVVAEQEQELASKEAGATRLKDVKEAEGFVDTATQAFKFGLGALGESLPQMATTLLGTGAGSVAARTLGRTATAAGQGAATVGKASAAASQAAKSAVDFTGAAMVGGMTTNVPWFYGMNREAQKEAIKQGKRIELSEGAAFLAAIPQAALDVISDSLVAGIGKINPVSGLSDLEAMTRRGGLYTRGAKGVALGTITEVPTELGQQVIERYQAGQDLTSPEAMDEYIEVMAAAGLVGGSIRGASNVFQGDLKKQEDAEEARAEQKKQDELDREAKLITDAEKAERDAKAEAEKQTAATAKIDLTEQWIPLVDSGVPQTLRLELADSGFTPQDIDRYRAGMNPVDGKWNFNQIKIMQARRDTALAEEAQAQAAEELDVDAEKKERLEVQAQKRIDDVRTIVAPGAAEKTVRNFVDAGLTPADLNIADADPDTGKFTEEQLLEAITNKGFRLDNLGQADVTPTFILNLMGEGFTFEDVATYGKEEEAQDGKYSVEQFNRMLERKNEQTAKEATEDKHTALRNLFKPTVQKYKNFKKTLNELVDDGLTVDLIARRYGEVPVAKLNTAEGLTLNDARAMLKAEREALVKEEAEGRKGLRIEDRGWDHKGEVGKAAYIKNRDEFNAFAKKYGVSSVTFEEIQAVNPEAEKEQVTKQQLEDTIKAKAFSEKGYEFKTDKAREFFQKPESGLTTNDLTDPGLLTEAEVKDPASLDIENLKEIARLRFFKNNGYALATDPARTFLTNNSKVLSEKDLKNAALLDDARIPEDKRDKLDTAHLKKILKTKNAVEDLFRPNTSPATLTKYKNKGLLKGDVNFVRENLRVFRREYPEAAPRFFPYTENEIDAFLKEIEPVDGVYTQKQLDRVLEFKEAIQGTEEMGYNVREARRLIRELEKPIRNQYASTKKAWFKYKRNATEANKTNFNEAKKELLKLVSDPNVDIPEDLAAALVLTPKTKQFSVVLTKSFDSEGRTSIAGEGLAPELRTDEGTLRSALDYFLELDRKFFNRITIAANPVAAGLEGVNPNTAGLVTTDQRVFLFTDNIQKGNELGVFLHEVGQHLGMRTLLGANYNSLVENIKRFAKRKDDSVESILADVAVERTKLANTELSAVDDELVAYFIEEAVNRGISPTEEISRKSALGNFFRKVMAGIRKALRVFGINQNSNAQEIVDLAYGAANLALRTPFEKLTQIERDYNSVLSAPERLRSFFGRENPNTGESHSNKFQFWIKDLGIIPNVRRLFRTILLGGLELNMLSDTIREHYKYVEGGVLSSLGNRLANRIDRLDAVLNRKVSDAKRLAVDSTELEIEVTWEDAETRQLRSEIFNTEEAALNRQAELEASVAVVPKTVKKQTIGWGLDPLITRGGALRAKYGDEIFNQYDILAHEASRLQVRVQEELTAEALGKLSPEQRKVYDDYRNLIASRPDLDAYFTEVQNFYKNMWRTFRDILANRFGPENVNKYMRKIGIDPDNFTLNPYLPLWREGDYTLSYTDDAGDFVIRNFKTRKQLVEAARDAERLKYTEIKTGQRSKNIDSQIKRTNTDIADIIGRIKNDDKLSGDPALQESLEAFLVEQVDSSGLGGQVEARSGTRRGLKGYDPDMLNALANIGTQMAGQLANIQHNGELVEIHNDINRIAEEAEFADPIEKEYILDIQNEMDKRRDFHVNPVNAYLSNFLTGVSFKYFILGNASSALVNLTSIPIQSFGLLARTHGPLAASKALMSATKMMFKGLGESAANTKLTVPGLNINLSDKTAFTKDMMEKNPELKELFVWSTARGGIRSSYNPDYDVLEIKAKQSPTSAWWDRTSRTLGWTFQNTERATREVTMIAAYNLERDRQKALSRSDLDAEMQARLAEEPEGSQFVREFANDPKALEKEMAREKALQTVYRSQTSGLRAAGSRWLQGNIGKVFGSLKSFAMAMLYMQWTIARDIFKGASQLTGYGSKVEGLPNPGKAAAKMWMSLSLPAWLFAGIPGVPLYFVAEAMFQLAQNFDDDEDDETLESWLNRNLADFASRGPFGAITGLDIADRVAFKEMFIRDDPYRMEKLGYPMYVTETLMGPIFSVMRRSSDSLGALAEGVRDKGFFSTDPYLEASKFGLPLALSNISRSLDPSFGKNRKGDILTENRGVDDRIWQMLGFGDFESKTSRLKMERMRGLKKKALDRKSSILAEINLARSSGAGMPPYVRDMIQRYNRSTLAKTEVGPITGKTLATSMRSFQRRRQEAERNRRRFGVPYAGASPDSSARTYVAAGLRQ